MTALSDLGSGSHLHAYQLGSDIYMRICFRLLWPCILNNTWSGFINLNVTNCSYNVSPLTVLLPERFTILH